MTFEEAADYVLARCSRGHGHPTDPDSYTGYAVAHLYQALPGQIERARLEVAAYLAMLSPSLHSPGHQMLMRRACAVVDALSKDPGAAGALARIALPRPTPRAKELTP